jgi:arsenate reductase-like glutaredoxin family protein
MILMISKPDCGACRKAEQFFKNNNVEYIKLMNTDKTLNVIGKIVMGFPTFIKIENNSVTGYFSGNRPKKLKQWIGE